MTYENLIRLSEKIRSSNTLNHLVEYRSILDFSFKSNNYKIHSFIIGTRDKSCPTLLITGGVHGIEKIGSQLAWSLLKSTIDRLEWDKALQDLLEKIRIVFIPIINPVGHHFDTRCNGNNVDLMRNAPINAIDKVPFLVGGHRLTKILPWYRGEKDKIEPELKALNDFLNTELLNSKCLVSLDLHSGFGMKDRIWFPFSYTKKPFDDLGRVEALINLLNKTHPYHIYHIEPQSHGYLLNGDIWDYFYLNFQKNNPNNIFIPFTLEMGSWIWVKKNPMQLFLWKGLFNPIKEHRIKRTYRRHFLLFDFLIKSLYSHTAWSALNQEQKESNLKNALERWYVK